MAKKILIVAAWISLALSPGCENANLFNSHDSEEQHKLGIGPSGETAIAMNVQGGFAGVNRDLLIETNGYIRYMDHALPEEQIVSMLTPEEYNALVAYFLEKDFFNLEEEYFEPNTADLFVYNLRFQHARREKAVATDQMGAPGNLQDLITRLNTVIEDLKHKALRLSFGMDRQTLQHGQSVELKLTATNEQAQALVLTSGVQMFEFFAIPSTVAPRLPEDYSSSFAWNYTHDKAFIMIIQSTTLAPAESLVFRAHWDGRANDGSWLEGDYLIGAQLISAPGGYTGLQTLHIRK